MATTKVSELTELTSAADNDLFLVADVSTNQSKKITKANLGISDENFTSALKTKLDGIEASATADQTGAEIKTAYEGEADTNAFTDAEQTKLSGIEANADVTDTANVVASLTAGTNITIAGDGTISATDTDTGILNVVEDTTPQLGGDLDTNGNAITGSTVAINSSNGEFMISATENGPVALRYDNNLKLSTKSDGVNITGELEADSLDIDGDGDITGNLTLGGNLNLGDNDKAQFGASQDLQIYHDGSNSFIDDAGTGTLNIQSNGTQINLQKVDGTKMIEAINNGNVVLYSNGVERIRTNGTGIDVTGEITADGIALGDSEKATFGASDDLQIYHSGSDSLIRDEGTGNFIISTNGTAINVMGASNSEYMAQFVQNEDVRLYYDNSQKFNTTSTGIEVTGTVTTDTARSADVVDNDGSFDLDAGTNFTCTPTGNITLTFTNIPDGQSGTIVLVNTGGHTISAASTTKVMGADMLTTITTAGTYVIGYISDGTNVRVYNSLAQQ